LVRHFDLGSFALAECGAPTPAARLVPGQPGRCQSVRASTSDAPARCPPALSPHVEFVDVGGHGYGTVRLTGDEMRTEFVCIPRPITRSDRPDGGPLRYRVVHSANL
jgi:hypothetical protein